MNLGLRGLVTSVSPTINVVITYGIAATLWAVVGTGVGWLIPRFAAP
jgi:hypothetical protein